MPSLNRQTAGVGPPLPVRVLQFGGGNFLRGFADWIFDQYNDRAAAPLGVLVVKPTARGDYQDWRAQEGLYHVLTQGIRAGKEVDEVRLIRCVSRIVHPYREWEAYLATAEIPTLRYIVSNTTESGLETSAADTFATTPPHTFPAKLTQWLYRRFTHFKGAAAAGCVLLPTELLADNGPALRAGVLHYADQWGLEAAFATWIRTANHFCSTLVDRIVPGIAPERRAEVWERLGYTDYRVTAGEPYYFWAIEALPVVREELPLDRAGLHVVYTDDLAPYRTRKVRILNGAHTAMVPVGLLAGVTTVREVVTHGVLGRFVRRVIDAEILPTLDGPAEELRAFADDVLDRFRNPFSGHRLESIALNSVAKFRARLLPTLLAYPQRRPGWPAGIVLALAALLRFYRGDPELPVNDVDWVTEFLAGQWQRCDGSEPALAQLARNVLAWEAAWGQDLSQRPGLAEQLTAVLLRIECQGMLGALGELE
jgi:tagaturonate reductase